MFFDFNINTISKFNMFFDLKIISQIRNSKNKLIINRKDTIAISSKRKNLQIKLIINNKIITNK